MEIFTEQLHTFGGGEGAATLPVISDLQNCDTDLLKPFHFFSKSSDFDENKLKYQFFLLSIKINDETIHILCCRRTFSDVLESKP